MKRNAKEGRDDGGGTARRRFLPAIQEFGLNGARDVGRDGSGDGVC